jgi:hypothetical protein
MKKEIDLSYLADAWPAEIVVRTEVDKFSGGFVSPKYLANLDSQGLGPNPKVRIGRKVGYRKRDLIAWLEKRAEIFETKEGPAKES